MTRTLAELSKQAVIVGDSVTFPGARAPERSYRVDSAGVRLAVYEWGDAGAPVVLLLHGGFDFARTFDVFAPLLADGGWRVVSFDQRGHGDSDRSALWSLTADQRDTVAVLNHVSPTAPAVLVGHSKGGSLSIRLAEALPHRFSHFVNIEGLPTRRSGPDIADSERTRMAADDLRSWVDHRERADASVSRKPGTLEDLARRRARMNPRLTHEWLCYLVTVGAQRGDDGWRWKIDPMMRMGGFGPFRPDWALHVLPALSMPLLGVLCTGVEPMSWGATEESLRPYLPPQATTVTIDAGHFVHIERPAETAAAVLDFLGDPRRATRGRQGVGASPTEWPIGPGSRVATTHAAVDSTPSRPLGPGDRTVRHGRVALALHRLTDASGPALLLLHGLGERSPATAPAGTAGWPGPVFALDFTGHGESTVPASGGYSCEALMADGAMAVRALVTAGNGPVTVVGRGLGGYVSLLLGATEAERVRGVVIADGAGIAGGGAHPGSAHVAEPAVASSPEPGVAPDPFALTELSGDVRPPDYATAFVRLLTERSALDGPVTVSAVARPPWLQAVVDSYGVLQGPLAEALRAYAQSG